jgi:hypothetical protein
LAVTTATGLSTTGGRVFNTRLFELGQADTPCWSVATDDAEQSQRSNLGGRLERNLPLIFSGYARATSNIQDILDLMASELEAVITPTVFRALAKDIYIESTDFDLAADDLDNLFGIIVVTYRVIYHTSQGVPDLAI